MRQSIARGTARANSDRTGAHLSAGIARVNPTFAEVLAAIADGMSAMVADDVPAGFELMPPFGPFHELTGPLYFAQATAQFQLVGTAYPGHPGVPKLER